jgi:hypothetical protein
MLRELQAYFANAGARFRYAGDVLRRTRLLVVVAALGTLAPGCDTSTGPPAASLRIRNAGATPLSALRVGFPEAGVAIGDVPAGATTAYHAVPGGVYGYAAFRFTHQGKEVIQPVIDWVGEAPLEGRRFTYTVALITSDDRRGPWIDLLDVARDR